MAVAVSVGVPARPIGVSNAARASSRVWESVQ